MPNPPKLPRAFGGGAFLLTQETYEQLRRAAESIGLVPDPVQFEVQERPNGERFFRLRTRPQDERPGAAGAGTSNPLHPWKLLPVEGGVKVYGTGATVEKRWSGVMFEVAGLDTPIALEESLHYVYLAATFTAGPEIDSFAIETDTEARQRVVVSEDYSEQVGLNILIGTYDAATLAIVQRLRDPLVVTLTCAAGVPAWVPVLSEGVAP